MNDPKKRQVKMKIGNGKFFYLPCDKAHEIREIIEQNADKHKGNCSYHIADLE